MSRYIHNLILQGEHQQLDFKFEISDAKKIARTFSAFANTDGGKLLIGVKDNGNIAGVRTDEEAYMVESSAHIFCKPRVEYKIYPHKIKDKTILEVVIPESNSKPHKAPWKKDKYEAFIRVKDENFVANDIITEVWRLKSKGKGVLVRYDDYEEQLFSLLKEQQEIILPDFISKCKIKPYLAKKILANMISIDLIKYRITETQVYYQLV